MLKLIDSLPRVEFSHEVMIATSIKNNLHTALNAFDALRKAFWVVSTHLNINDLKNCPAEQMRLTKIIKNFQNLLATIDVTRSHIEDIS